MSPALLEEAIRDRIKKGKTPKAIILTHLYGMSACMDELTDVAEKYEIPLIEDAAEALGSMYKSQHLGTMGEMGILSFNGNKIITTSGGGALISDNKNFCNHALFLATQARDKAPWYQHSHIGYNYRMSNIAAGIGRGQMEVLQNRIRQRRDNFFFYKDMLKDIDEISFPEEPDEDYFSNHWLTTFTMNSKTKSPEALRQYLQEYNIETRPLWKPMHLQPVFKDAPAYTDGTSEQLFGKGLCLPSSSNLTDEERNFVVEKTREYFGK
jgi:dTDP-4-amino-4,6-dideoxygalactose transaminase